MFRLDVLQVLNRIKLGLCVMFVAILCAVPSFAMAQGQMPEDWAFDCILDPGAVAYSPDGTFLAVGGEGSVQVYSVSTGQPVRGLATAAEYVASLSFSKDSKTLLVAGSGASTSLLELWNVSNGTLISTIAPTGMGINSAALSPDGSMVVAGGANSTQGLVEIWNAVSGTLRSSPKTAAKTVYSVAFSPDGKLIADGGESYQSIDSVLELWNASDGSLLCSLDSTGYRVASVAFSPDGQTLAAGAAYSAGVWSTSTYRLIASYSESWFSIESVGFSPDGQTLGACGSWYWTDVEDAQFWSGGIELWSVATGTPISQSSPAAQQHAMAFSPDGQTIAGVGLEYIYNDNFIVGMVGVLGTYKAKSLDSVRNLATGATQNYFSLPVFSSDGKSILGGGLGTAGSALSLWDASSGLWLSGIGNSQGGYATACGLSPDGKTVAIGLGVAGGSGLLQLWDIASDALLGSLETNMGLIMSIQYSPDGSKLAVGGSTTSGDVIEIWNPSTGVILSTLNTSAVSSWIAVAFSPDGATIADCANWINEDTNPMAVLQLWNVSSAKLLSTLDTAATTAYGVSFSPDGKTVALSGLILDQTTYVSVGELEVWDVRSGQLIATLPLAPGTESVGSTAFSPNGKTLFAATDTGIQVYSAVDYGMLGYVDGFAYSISLSPDGSRLASISGNGGVTFYSVPVIGSATLASLTLSPSSVQGGTSVIGTATLSKPAPPGGITIGLYAPNIFEIATFTPTVFVPEGANAATFTVATYGVSTETEVSITASIGPSSKTAKFALTPPNLISISFAPPRVLGGKATTGTITLSGPGGPGGVIASLSTNSHVVAMDRSVVLVGNSATFNVLTSVVGTDTPVNIVVTLSGASMTGSLTVETASITNLTINPTSIKGGSGAKGTLTLSDKAGPGGLKVSLNSSNADVMVPGNVIVPAGLSQASFTVTTLPVSTTTYVTVTVKAGSVVNTAPVTINPPQLLSLSLNPPSVIGGRSSVGVVTLNGPAGPTGAVIKLASSTDSASLPATIVVPAGKNSASFTVKTYSVSSPAVATISAVLNGATQTATLTIEGA